MKKKAGIALMVLTIVTSAYADDSNNVAQGAADYDWQSCFSNKASDCINDCATSSDLNCKENCNSMASDKCKSEGFSPPSPLE